MKIAATLLLLALSTLPAAAGNWFGSGPWANGAYYPGQFDGYYSATVSGTNAISGIIGFGLNNGTPTTLTNSAATSITVNPNDNYFVIYLDGRTYAGTTIANINVDSKKVTGGLLNGIGPTYTGFITNTNVTVPASSGTNTTFPTITNTTVSTFTYGTSASGGFSADLTSDKSLITFVGNNTGFFAPSVSTNIIPSATNTFSLNGIKVGNRASVSP
jgi:hypothetical protein